MKIILRKYIKDFNIYEKTQLEIFLLISAYFYILVLILSTITFIMAVYIPYDLTDINSWIRAYSVLALGLPFIFSIKK